MCTAFGSGVDPGSRFLRKESDVQRLGFSFVIVAMLAAAGAAHLEFGVVEKRAVDISVAAATRSALPTPLSPGTPAAL